MESDPENVSPTDAAEQLRTHDALRRRIAVHGRSRGLSVLTLYAAVLIAAYMAVFLIVFADQPSEGAGSDGSAYVSILIFGVLVLSSLLGGARERFGVRAIGSPRSAIAGGIAIAGFMTLAGLSVAGVSYPWGLNLLVVAGVFLAISAGPLRQLAAPAAPGTQRWVSEPLSRHARRSTILIGVGAGLLVGTSTFPLLGSIVGTVVMLALVVVLLSWRARWGLPRTGYEWGPIHWAAFGLVVALLFLVTLLLSRTDWITAPIAIVVAVVVAAVMLIASAVPTRSRRR